MKKNKLFLLGLFVVFAAVLSLSLVSNTLAKYTTSDSGSDTARVAKWGVTVAVIGAEEAFGKKYDDAIAADGTKVVSTEDVLAPGTNGTLGQINIDGQPEVMVNVNVSLTITLTNWVVDHDDNDGTPNTFYCPIIFKAGTETVDGREYVGKADEFKAAIEALVNKKTNNVAANTDLSSAYDVTVTWEWAFGPEGNQTDIADTALGNAATTANKPTIIAEWSAEVTQVN